MTQENEFEDVEMTLGEPEFNAMLMQMTHEVNASNASEYNFMGNTTQEVGENVWAVPAYLSDEYALFFLYTEIDTGDWVLAFSEADLGEGQFNLGAPMTTGEGLNKLFEQDPDRAKMVLSFVNDMEKAGEGMWRMVEQ
ncbi:hypothetical protein ACIPCB_06950 [Pediococcus pentosaceus]|jgi:hypothetical protein|uniref:hypothetical protein n=1 Tax=Pediococcus pentosaceus TaxID=1255 RepID=UPI0006D8BFB1|nr:hypothetical protein [Pediococcus pentosaceus]ANI97506.1 hypothetical protein AN278_002975 [Pediococcus pentosaceus]ASC08006.1 hypothetical protein S100194_00445 [Pediococcus pentosaceus]AVL01915.1 hypothetical protein PP40703_03470 [Pediococcus pentosaceus]KQB80331.1 hypothetical protein AN278_05905 [Pediococcus pentosaceus]MBF7113622.1 hypothetical protein [Pediococcus pentosaceus]